MIRFLPVALLAFALNASGQIAHDDASQAAYGAGWADAANGGAGFGAWNFKTLTNGDNSHAGFYIADVSDHPDLKGAAVSGKAFGMYANGEDFEVASAFRAFSAPVAAGQSFEVTIEVGPFEKKFEKDADAAGAVGFTLRTGNEGNAIDDYNKGARFEFGIYGTGPNYTIYDGQEDHDTGIPRADGGVKVKLTLTDADTYDLEITTLANQQTKKLAGRKLGGTAGGAIESVCLFDRNWEKNDAYFNDLTVSAGGAAPASSSPAASGTGTKSPASAKPSATPIGL